MHTFQVVLTHTHVTQSHNTRATLSKGTHLPDINPSILLSLGVPVPEFSHDSDGVQSGILSQSVGDDLHGLCKASHTVSLHTSEALGVGHQLLGDLNLWCTTPCY